MANANANANVEIYKHEKTITLNKLVPSEYRVWVIQAEATLGVYECLEIVRGTEQNPTPPLKCQRQPSSYQCCITREDQRLESSSCTCKRSALEMLQFGRFDESLLSQGSASAIWTRSMKNTAKSSTSSTCEQTTNITCKQSSMYVSHINQFT